MLVIMGKELRQIFKENLKFYRKQQNLSQSQLDIQLNMGANYTNGIENRGNLPSFETIEKICDVLKIQPKQLFDLEGSPRNIIDFDKEGFVKEVTEELYRRLSSDIKSCIKKELEQIVGKKIS